MPAIAKAYNEVMFILYVEDQVVSANFYKQILEMEAVLDVPGMTEFALVQGCRLGLMPNKGIARLLGDRLPAPSDGNGVPRCELYLYVDSVESAFDTGLSAGAFPVSPVADRDWGDRVCYFADPDGHIIAFAQKTV